MAVLALTNAKGAPGVSTAALAMTLLWPRSALLVEADPAGSSVLAGYLRGTVDHSRGLLGLAMAHRHGELREALWTQTVPLTSNAPGAEKRWLLPGISDATQGASTTGLWGPLAAVLASLDGQGVDVLVDAGRAGAAQPPTALLRQADLVLLVLDSSLPAVAAARARLGLLAEELALPSAAEVTQSRLRLLLIGEGRPYNGREIAASLGVPLMASLAWDPVNANVLTVGASPGRRFDSCPLLRSARAAINASRDLMAENRHRLLPPATDPTSTMSDGHRPAETGIGIRGGS
jgi:hypothetical protein